MKTGFIKKHIANLYTVVDDVTKKEVICQARGKFRYIKVDEESAFHRSISKRTKVEPKWTQVSPKVGDRVRYNDEEEQALITEIMPRDNDLNRPDVANIDQALLVFSAVRPDFSFHLLDQFLVIMSQEHITPVIVISKIDLIEEEPLQKLKEQLTYYETIGIPVYYVNSKNKDGFEALKKVFKDHFTLLAGQTGVGKSTLLNALMPHLDIKTQEISEALGRGKHTTRHTELYDYLDGYVVDTPGFSKLEFMIHYPEDLKLHYPDFLKYQQDCRFSNKCNHVHEPGCAVKEAVESGLILQERYENYVAFFESITTQKEVY